MTAKERSPASEGKASKPADSAPDSFSSWPPDVVEPLQMTEDRELVAMLRHWKRYGENLKGAAGRSFYLDSTFAALRQGWRQIGEGFLLLLHSDFFELEAQTLEVAIREVLALPIEQGEEQPSENFFDGWGPSAERAYEAYSYSRAEALEDGVLLDVTDIAKEAGFRLPVAITQGLWADINSIPKRIEGTADAKGRLWDILFLGVQAIKKNGGDSLCLYPLEMPVGEAARYEVKAHCGPDDNGEPVITLMKPNED